MTPIWEDHRSYIKSKDQLIGIIRSMTDKVLNKKLVTLLQQQTAELKEKLVGLALTSNAAEVTRYKNLRKLICSVFPHFGADRADQFS